ncbi:fatty acid synthase [Thelephora ganbajun]|uniref:Fatty acid synthase n=1 Tax=Thelephora ganbajun TaxID=370292 RepID=A0ACB6ZGH3_THEGA|nr:fatty acid synthase [Thelephora ganbajun]
MASIATRPLILQLGEIRVSIPVSTVHDEWISAEILRESFIHSQKLQDAIDTTTQLENDSEATVELFARFLAFVAQNVNSDPNSSRPRTNLLYNAFKHFTESYLASQDVHTFTSAFDLDVRRTVISSYFKALATIESSGITDIPRQPPSALFAAAKDGEASIYAVFGGQGTNEVYFDELQNLYDLYTPYVAPFIQTITDELFVPLVRASSSSYDHGLEVSSWLSGYAARPPITYLASVAVSFPIIGLTQLTQYLVAFKVAGLTPGEMLERFSGTTGHSQGIVSAVAISASSTYEQFASNSKKALKWLFLAGSRAQVAFPVVSLEPSIIADSAEGGEGVPSPMLTVVGLNLKDLERHVAATNKYLPDNSKLCISLHNSIKAFVVTGPSRALYGLVTALRKSKVPFSKRKPVFHVRFLLVGVPFHSPYLTGAVDGEELWKADELHIPVYHTADGSDLRSSASSITRSITEQIFTLPLHWTKAIDFPETATHAIDFGPGGANGVGPIVSRILKGRGVRVIVLGDKSKGDELYDSNNVKYEDWWSKKWAPRLVKTSDGTIHIDTPFSRLLGKPPIMVAGMTPSTVKAGFVSAVLSAGYHIELAGGGHYNPAALRSKVAEIQAKIPAGVGITLNSLYINPRQFTFQLPLWQEMRREGLPIEGFCVAAGIPTTEKAAEIIEGLAKAGIKHVSFKPVTNTAPSNPHFPIILRWTGGRTGGHHSCEDVHQPILSTYSSIRQHHNIILIGGSGFGGSEDLWPYLTGDWSVEYGVQPMPFDGFLFASRVMIAKEAHTSSSVKDLIVAAPGVVDAHWEGTYDKETGGVLTVRSELGEPIHKIATRGVKLWKEFDNTVFAVPKEKRAAWLAERRAEIIDKLNRNFQKPWFGWKKDGTAVEDLSDMTYEETVLRMVRLMYVSHQNRWVDLSLRNLTGDWLRRIEERFAGVNGGGQIPSILQSFTSLDQPHTFVEEFFKKYPTGTTQLVSAEDKAYFLAIAQRPSQKPVPFIPILDASFEVWFKKDSLWQAEDIDAVFDQDPQRICILQGPVAVAHSKIKDEPINDMFGNITKNLIKKLLDRYYDGDASTVPTIDYLAPPPTPPAVLVKSIKAKGSLTFHVPIPVPDASLWLENLAGPHLSWLRALLTSPTIVRDSSYVNNPIRRLLTPRTGQKVVIHLEGATPTGIEVFGAIRSYGPQKEDFKAIEIKYAPGTRAIDITAFEERRGVAVPLFMKFNYVPSLGSVPIHEVADGRNLRIKDFYWRLWFGDNETLPSIGVRETFYGPKVTVTAKDIETFCDVVGNQSEAFKTVRNDRVQAPMDFGIVTGWQAIMKAIFPQSIDGDLLNLVYLSNGFCMLDGASPLHVGDVVTTEAKVASVINTDAGKAVKVIGNIVHEGKPVIEVTSSFLYRGRFTDYGNTFEIVQEPDYIVDYPTDASIGVLLSKEWFELRDQSKPLITGTSLIFRLKSEITFRNKFSYHSITVSGDVYVRDKIKRLVKVGYVDFEQEDCHGNPVVAYVQRHGTAEGTVTYLPNDGYTMTDSTTTTFTTPSSNQCYSNISKDFNPIHVNPYFSNFASLPGTITHGMWTSAASRKYLESVVAKGRPERVKSYEVSFVDMVLPEEELHVKIKHIGMRQGNMVVKVETYNDRDVKVLEGTAEVAQPPTAYVFTGQGSQEPGMGMELYNNSPAARAVWDAADAHLLAVYGFSIIEIVKDNPKEKTVHFGGIKGQAIRTRYMEMTYDTMDKDGVVRTLPLFGDINARTQRYTFSHPNGLLFATQFAQIALVVTEKAAFEDMQSKGFIQNNAVFAGHSLGEYSALASVAGVLPISSLVDVVFYRGITMQRAVERDSANRSNYAMCAVNPSRISPSFNDSALREVVDDISRKTNCLLEIVNFNVEGQQYVCAGELVALQTMTNVLNYLKIQKVDLAKLSERFTIEEVKKMLGDIIESCFASAQEKQKEDGYITLEQGFATIPLPGIDVPFHSRYLWAGVMPFRAYLGKKINPLHLNPDMLVGRYIPNLIAKPFEVTKEYAQIIYDQTSSPRLDKVLRKWDEEGWSSVEQRKYLAYVTLVELLAYQFASLIRWIETQDLLFTVHDFERFIEIGPSPTLTGMATRTLKAKYEAGDDSVSRTRAILCHAKNTKEVYYQFEDEAAAEDRAPEPPAASVPAPIVTVQAPVTAAPAPVAAAVSVQDAPIKSLEILTVIIAQKLKKPANEVPLSKSIKDLVGGKSTLQNEILGDLGQEFSSAPEKGEELPLEELGAALGVGFSGNLGKYTTGLVSRLIGGKMPGGFNLSAIKTYLSKNDVLLGTTMEPPKRLGSEAEAKAWLDGVVALYAQRSGITLSSASSGGSGGGAGGGGAVMNSEEFLKFQAEQYQFAGQQIELYSRYLKKDSRAGDLKYDAEKANSLALQARLDALSREHGDFYVNGILPAFDALKARRFDSSWNWARQDSLLMWYDIIHGKLTTVDREITARCIDILNRADPDLYQFMQYSVNACDPTLGENYALARQFGQQLIENCREVVNSAPLYKDVTFPTAPNVEINEKGDVIVTEVVREGVRKLEAYVEEMSSSNAVNAPINVDKVHASVLKLWNVVQSQPGISEEQVSRIKDLYNSVINSLSTKSPETKLKAAPQPRARRASSQFLRPQVPGGPSISEDKIPLLHLKRKVGTNWEYSSNLTGVYLDILNEIATSGTSFKDKNALLTGVGKGSIGVEILKGLLSGGAHVVITTSRYSRATVEYYQAIFQRHGSKGSALTVVPFNQASKQDVEALIDYIYTSLGMDLDYILPFAALPENGREIDGLDDKSELAHRMMLVNILRLMGAVKNKKASRNFVTRPTQVILPLSPNHGLFGNDGLYSESKISLETLFNRWSAESWGEYLCLAGAVIGWTRGTGLMSAAGLVSQELESYGVRTFSAKEMAFNILGLMHPLLFSITQVESIWADLNGGMDRLPDLADITSRIRSDIMKKSDSRRAIARDNAADFKVINGIEAERILQTVYVTPRANFKFDFPTLPSAESLQGLSKLRNLIDLDRVIVNTGFAEVGPWGSSRTRWEMEVRGDFTLEGWVEMAWIMGYIKHFDGRLKNGSLYVGWVESKSGEPVDEKDVKSKFEKDILAHAGVRLIEPELWRGYDPKKKVFNQEVELVHDLEPMEVSEADAKKFKNEHGAKCDIWTGDGGEWFVKFKKGSRILVPKAFEFNRHVAGQIPTGWDAGRYGIPDDIASQVDRTTLWALVCTAEALNMSGITDPYELYKYMHPSEVGSSLGSGMGGMLSLQRMFKDRREEKEVQNDILQETFINTTAGWVNLLLLSSSGPIKIPVGACATALQSIEIACDTLLSGKAKVMIAGGFDDISEEGSYEFANMKATSNSETEFAMGREPTEMSRPATTTRAGFMESQGTGVHILMSARTALELGAPIRGIVAFTSTSTDKAGRSIPAPGMGALSVAREVPSKHPPQILAINYRSRQLTFRRKQISDWMNLENDQIREELQAAKAEGEVDEEYFATRLADVEREGTRQEKEALATYGMLEGSDPRIAPLRRALAVWGLTTDDLGVLSIHGTSTGANERNETHIWNDIFTQISRTPGNAIPIIAQKSLVGHSKGGSASWQMIGLLQSVNTGIIPGNRNNDNVDAEFRKYTYLMFPSKSIHTDGIRAGVMSSFGFGQVGGTALIVHPRYLLAALEPSAYEAYRERNRLRYLQSYKAMSEMMTHNSLVKIKDGPPYTPDIEGKALLNSLARATLSTRTGQYTFTKPVTEQKLALDQVLSISKLLSGGNSVTGVGVDQELISAVPSHNPTFVERNFTEAEIAYCQAQPSSQSSFAARWAGKEAVFKSLGVASKGAGAAMREIEILPDESGAPRVILHGDAKGAADSKGIKTIHISLSHSETTTIAFAQASTV